MMKKNKINVNGLDYGYNIFPHYDMVKAEIYRVSSVSELKGTHIHLLSKSFGGVFGGLFRKPIEKDYIKAKEWACNHLEFINTANREQDFRKVVKVGPENLSPISSRDPEFYHKFITD